MAEVTGTLGDQPIELNNAATESTLKQLLAAMNTMMKNSAKTQKQNDKIQKDYEAEIKKLFKSTKDQNDILDKHKKKLKDLTDATEDQTKATEDQTKAEKERKKAQDAYNKKLAEATKGAQATADMFGSLAGAITGSITKMTDLIGSMADVGNSMTSAASTMKAIPLVGGALASVFGAVAGAAEKSYKSFQQSASVGANFGGSITEMINSASGAGLTFDQFAGIIAKNGEAVALLGKGSGDGARNLAKFGKAIRESGAADELYRLGYSTEDINNGMAQFAGRLAMSGKLQNMTTEQVAKVTGEYLTQLDAVSKLTGKSKQALQEEEAARMRDAQWLNLKSRLDADGQKNLETLMATIPKEMQEGAKEVLATGTATSKAGRDFMAYMNKSGQSAQALNQAMTSSGKLTLSQTKQFANEMQAEGKSLAKSDLGNTLSKFGDDSQKRMMVGAYQYSAQQANLGKVLDEQQKEAEERKKKEKELADKGLDPASMEKYKQKLAETSNEFTKILANSKMLGHMMTIFEKLSGIIDTVVAPAFGFVAENFNLVAITVGSILAPMIALRGLIFLAGVAEKAKMVMTFLTTGQLGFLSFAAGASAGSLMLLGAPVLAIVAGIALLVAGVYAVYKGFEWITDKVKSAGWTFGDTIEAIKDNLKNFMLTLADGFLWLLDKVTFGDANKKIKQAQQAIKLEKDELAEREKARDQRRKEQSEKYEKDKALKKQKEEEEESSKKVTDAKKAEAEASEKKTELPGLDYSSPEKLYASALRSKQVAFQTQTQPGAKSAAPGGTASPAGPQAAPNMSGSKIEGLGKVAAHFESGGKAGTVSSGHGDFGGKSYGAFQLSSKTGDVDKFLKSSGYADQFKGMAVGSAEFDKKWKELGEDKNFAAAQQAHAKKSHYDPQVEKLKKAGLDLSGKGAGVQEAIMSTANQYGANTDVIQKALAGKDTSKMSDKDIINSIQDFKAQSIGTRFKSSSAAVQAGVAKRVEQERAALLGVDGSSPVASQDAKKPAGPVAPKTPATATPATPVTPQTPAVTPVATQAAQTITPDQKAKADQTSSDKAKAELEKMAKETQSRTATVMPKPAQESTESLLSQLNMKMDKLIQVSAKTADLNSKQLSVQRDLSVASA